MYQYKILKGKVKDTAFSDWLEDCYLVKPVRSHHVGMVWHHITSSGAAK